MIIWVIYKSLSQDQLLNIGLLCMYTCTSASYTVDTNVRMFCWQISPLTAGFFLNYIKREYEHLKFLINYIIYVLKSDQVLTLFNAISTGLSQVRTSSGRNRLQVPISEYFHLGLSA